WMVNRRAVVRDGKTPPIEPHRGDAAKSGRHSVPLLPDHARRRREDEGPRGYPPVRHRGAPRTVALVDAEAVTSPAVKGFSTAAAREAPRGQTHGLRCIPRCRGSRRARGPRGL